MKQEEADIRTALLNYLLLVKEFYEKLYTPPIVMKMKSLFPDDVMVKTQEPLIVRIGRAEKWWLQNLFNCISTIEQTLTNIEQWRKWFLDLVHNLEFTDENIQQLSKDPKRVEAELRSHKMDEGYVRLIVNNATNDFFELVAKTRSLLNQLVELAPFIQRLESPILEIVEQQLERLKNIKFMDLLSQMQQLLAATYNAPTQDDFLRNLAALLHIFADWRQMLQLEDPTLDDPKAMREYVKQVRETMNTLSELTKAFQEFVKARELSDYYIRQAELSIIRMMISYEGTADKWWFDYIEAEPEEIEGFIPEKLDPHQLLIGATHSLALIEDLEQRLQPQMPNIKTTVGKLGEFLQSPAIQSYEEVVSIRLSFWEKYQQEWVSKLVNLRSRLHQLSKKLE